MREITDHEGATRAATEGAHYIGEPRLVWGVVSPKPIHGLPKEAKVRLRMRNEDFVYAVVRMNGGVTRCAVADCGDHWELVHPQGSNLTLSAVPEASYADAQWEIACNRGCAS